MTQSRREEDAVFEGTVSERIGRRIRQTSTFSKRIVVSDQVSTQIIGDRRVDIAFLPFMRSRKVFFKAEGLRPNTRYFPFFDGVKVDALCREESFERMANGTARFGERHRKRTTHPDGSTNLESDADGIIEGSFFIPSARTLRFKAGTREFKLLDINIDQNDAALSRAIASYTAKGQIETRVRDVESTRTIEYQNKRWEEVTWVDPLAQSFRVPKGEGIFVTKVQTYFKTRDSGKIPVQLQIRPMVNGSPSATEIVPGAVKFVKRDNVALPASQTQAAVLAAPTSFVFDEPIFLKGDTEYCIVLLADSKEYNAYVGETYAFQLGSTEKRIDRQPSMGSLFKSQNGTTWEPDQTKDMAFKLFRANFSTAGGSVVFENAPLDIEPLVDNPLLSTSGSSTVRVLFPEHGFRVGDTVTIDGATTGNGIAAGNINGDRTVIAADGFGFTFDANSDNANTDGRFGGNAVTSTQQKEFDMVTPFAQTLTPEATSINNKFKFTTGDSLASVTGSQTRYVKDATFSSDFVMRDFNRFEAPRLVATAANETAQIGSGEKSVTFQMDVDTSKNNVSPVIDAQRLGLAITHNRIDKQAQSPASGFNVPLTYVAETDPTSGSHMSKWITNAQSLVNDAIGLKILIGALRPPEASFDVYWRTANEGENIYANNWTRISGHENGGDAASGRLENAIAPDEFQFREYEYLVGGQAGNMTPFLEYQIKIVMMSTNSSKVPYFKDLRVITLAD